MARRDVYIEPNATIGDLVSRLGDDGKRLLGDEVRLAKIEVGENVKEAGRGLVWLGVALAFAFVALTALTVAVAALIGRVFTDALWFGTLLTGLLWLMIGGVLARRGVKSMGEPSYTLAQTRREIVLTRDAIARADRT